MSLRRLPPILAVLLAFCLLGAQQAIHGHLLGHAAAAMAATADSNGSGDDALPHACDVCVAFAALAAAPPAAAILAAAAVLPAMAPAMPAAAIVLPAPQPPYASRAPPALP